MVSNTSTAIDVAASNFVGYTLTPMSSGGRAWTYRDKTMRTFEAGVTDSQTGEPRWTGQMTDAESAAEAEALFERAGFYRNFGCARCRNLVVRDVEYPAHFQRGTRSE